MVGFYMHAKVNIAVWAKMIAVSKDLSWSWAAPIEMVIRNCWKHSLSNGAIVDIICTLIW